MEASPTRWFIVGAAIAGMTSGGCGLFRPSVTLTPVSISRVSVDEMPAEIKRLPHGGTALRIDFYSTPELLSEDVMSVVDKVRFCDAGNADEELFGLPSPFLGGKNIFWLPDREEARALLREGPSLANPLVDSTYVYVSHTEHPASPGSRFHPGYDLAKYPRPLCLFVQLSNGYEIPRTTNTITFSAEQVADALRATRP